MNKLFNRIIVFGIMLLFLTGCHNSSKSENVSTFLSAQDKRESYRSLLEKEDEKIYVIGHKSPDTDTVGSAIAYAYFLNQLGYDSQPCIASKNINNETRYVLEKCDMEIPNYLDDASDKKVVMVDHNELIQAADGMDSADIVAVIDHHIFNNDNLNSIIKVRCENVGATATLIALEYEECAVEMEPAIARLLAYTIISDTENLQKNNTTTADKIVLAKLVSIAGLTDTSKIYEEMMMAKESYEGMTDEEIYFSDYKEYLTNGHTYAIPTFNVRGLEAVDELETRMRKVMSAQYATGKYDFIFAKIKEIESDVSYLFVYGEGAESVFEKAFPDVKYDGKYYVSTSGISRKKIMVPSIDNVLQSID